MILCDLPYGTTACNWDNILPFDKLWDEYNRIIKDNGAIVLTAAQPFTSSLIMSNPKLFKAAIRTNRRYITIEKDVNYHNIGNKRIEAEKKGKITPFLLV